MIMTDCVEGLGQINKGGTVRCISQQRRYCSMHFSTKAVLFDVFLLELARGKDHVGGPSICTEAALTFREETLLQVFQQAVEEVASQDLSCYGQKGDSSVVIVGLVISFLLVDVDNCFIS